jgi:hypothetical protein
MNIIMSIVASAAFCNASSFPAATNDSGEINLDFF